MKLSDKDMNLLTGGACPDGCKKQCKTKKKELTIKIECGNKKSAKASEKVGPLPYLEEIDAGKEFDLIHP